MPLTKELPPGTVVKVTRAEPSQYTFQGYHAKAGDVGLLTIPHYPIPRDDSQLRLHTWEERYLGPGGIVEPASEQEREQFFQATEKAQVKPSQGKGWYMGTDPEIFATTKSGKLIPAWKFLPGKKSPLVHKVSPAIKAFFDGFQAEVTTPPATCHDGLIDCVRWGLKMVWEKAKEASKGAGLSPASVMEFAPKALENAPADGVELGCAPSMNIYGEKNHLDGVEPASLPFRFAGCHIHFGCGAVADPQRVRLIVGTVDNIAGVVSVALLRGMEDPRRRLFYGLAGEYRLPPHGIEWRTLSSSILAHPALTYLMFDLARCAARMAWEGLSPLWQGNADETQDVINSLDVERADKIIGRNQGLLSRMFHAIYPKEGHAQLASRFVREGAIQNLAVEDVVDNWRLANDDTKLTWRTPTKITEHGRFQALKA